MATTTPRSGRSGPGRSRESSDRGCGGRLGHDGRPGVRDGVQVGRGAEAFRDVAALQVGEEHHRVEAVEVRHDPPVGDVEVAEVRVGRVGEVRLVEHVDRRGPRVEVARQEARGALRLVDDHGRAVADEVVEPQVVDVPGAAGQHGRGARRRRRTAGSASSPRRPRPGSRGPAGCRRPGTSRSAPARGARRRCAGTSGCPPPRPSARRCRPPGPCGGSAASRSCSDPSASQARRSLNSVRTVTPSGRVPRRVSRSVISALSCSALKVSRSTGPAAALDLLADAAQGGGRLAGVLLGDPPGRDELAGGRELLGHAPHSRTTSSRLARLWPCCST